VLELMPLDPDAVHEGAVAAVLVLNPVFVLVHHDLGVHSRGAVVAHYEFVVALPADPERELLDGNSRPAPRRVHRNQRRVCRRFREHRRVLWHASLWSWDG